MIVKCVNNDQFRAPDVFENGYRHPEYIHTDMTVGKHYYVYAMMIVLDDLMYLVQRDGGEARWTSPYFFSVVDDRLPSHWEYRYSVIEGTDMISRRGVRAIWGYPVLLNSATHNDNLHATDGSEPGVFEDVQLFREEVELRARLGC